ncbi:MAG TPA: pyrroline-5-carboxylate reductase [Acidimicrobiales bacterium]|nr:pyrroline-5-carboxylate reductase [Acidimicrobiales bacterium]
MVAKLLLVGGGKMGEALLRGLLRAGWARPEELVVSEVSEARRAQLTAEEALAGVQVVGGEPAPADGAVLAVKPADVEGACRALTSRASLRRVLSIAAGVRLADLEAWCAPGTAVIRAMPNTPALVAAAATAISAGPAASAEDMEWACDIMRAVGTVVEVPEDQLDAVTGLSGSGPAYLFLVAEAMTEAGVLVGLPRTVAASLVAQTLLGSGRLLAETGQSPQALRAAVTSPGGTTAAGLRQLEASAARAAFIEAVAAAVRRSRELARGVPG